MWLQFTVVTLFTMSGKCPLFSFYCMFVFIGETIIITLRIAEHKILIAKIHGKVLKKNSIVNLNIFVLVILNNIYLIG